MGWLYYLFFGRDTARTGLHLQQSYFSELDTATTGLHHVFSRDDNSEYWATLRISMFDTATTGLLLHVFSMFDAATTGNYWRVPATTSEYWAKLSIFDI